MSEAIEEIQRLTAENEELDAEVKRQAEALYDGSTEFVKNVKAEALEQDVERLTRQIMSDAETLTAAEKVALELMRVTTELERFRSELGDRKKYIALLEERKVELDKENVELAKAVGINCEEDMTLFETLEKRVGQLQVQLAGCSVAALGGAVDAPVNPGDYGHSASFDDVKELREKYDAAVEENRGLAETRNRFCGSVNRLAGILGLEGKDSFAPEAVERKAKAIMSAINLLDEATLKRDKQIEELEAENADLRSTFETLDKVPDNLRATLKKREAYAERLELLLGAKEEALEELKSRLDKGETFDDWEARVIATLTEDGTNTLKRLADFMRYTLNAVRENRELVEKVFVLEAENEHLSKSIDAMNATLQGADVLRGRLITTDELVEVMKSCFTDEKKRNLFPSWIEKELPRDVPEHSILEFSIRLFAREVGVELFRRDRELLDTATLKEGGGNVKA